jgi:hypothetical protein
MAEKTPKKVSSAGRTGAGSKKTTPQRPAKRPWISATPAGNATGLADT